MKKIIFTIVMLSFLGFSSCYYDKEANLYPAVINSNTCDTSTTTLVYGKTIKTIMDQNCSLSGCHNTTSAPSSGGVCTDTYADLTDAMDNRNLICTVEQTGCSAMPKGGIKLSDCKISQLKIWKSRNYPQ